MPLFQVDKGATHAVDFIYEIRVQVERTPMIPDTVNLLESSLAEAHSCENMDSWPFCSRAEANSVTCVATPPTAIECNDSQLSRAIFMGFNWHLMLHTNRELLSAAPHESISQFIENGPCRGELFGGGGQRAVMILTLIGSIFLETGQEVRGDRPVPAMSGRRAPDFKRPATTWSSSSLTGTGISADLAFRRALSSWGR